MRSPFRHLLWATPLLLATCLIAAPASGQVVTTSFGPFAVGCTPTSQLCDNVFSGSVATTSTLRVQYVASSGHCSNIAAHILVDGIEKAVTAFLTPGQASGFFDVGPVSPGTHAVALRAEGTVGGCNTGTLANWGGTMDVVHDAAVIAQSAAAVPTLSVPLLGVLAAALLIVAGYATSRRRR
jgi:hypothetical protein